ncbi:uncharacterized protein A4U43_C06F3470 [Asparagus officinalis]|uniref:Uncharacterized protein n=1 Tax=Asparagus officinalis TaxID=4686 RepID=A0A5P1EJB4_ASPOF|nr:uncharacterized protein A4U43_C06F3470 [Asparagus officinalis]
MSIRDHEVRSEVDSARSSHPAVSVSPRKHGDSASSPRLRIARRPDDPGHARERGAAGDSWPRTRKTREYVLVKAARDPPSPVTPRRRANVTSLPAERGQGSSACQAKRADGE